MAYPAAVHPPTSLAPNSSLAPGIIGEPPSCRHAASDTATRNGEFLLQLLKAGAQQKEPVRDSEKRDMEDGHIRDPAVAALGPCHPMPQFDMQRNQENQHPAQSPLRGWLPPSRTPIDFPFHSPADLPYHHSFEHPLPSPLDPPFRAPNSHILRDPNKHFPPPQPPFLQFPGGFHLSLDSPVLPFPDHSGGPSPYTHGGGVIHHAVSSLFHSPSILPNLQMSSEFACSASMPRQPLPGEVGVWAGSESGLHNLIGPRPQVFKQFNADGPELSEHFGSNAPGADGASSAFKRIQFDETFLAGGDSLNSSTVRAVKEPYVKDHGPIGPPKREDASLTDVLGCQWGAVSSTSQNLIDVRDLAPKTVVFSQEVGLAERSVLMHSENGEWHPIERQGGIMNGKLEFWPADSSRDVSDNQRDGYRSMLLLRRHQEVDDFRERNPSKIDSIVPSKHSTQATTQADTGINAHDFDPVDFSSKEIEHVGARDTGRGNGTRNERPSGRIRGELKKKGSNKPFPGQWVAVSREREADGALKEIVEGIGRVEVGSGLHSGRSEVMLPSRSYEGTIQKPRDDSKKRRGQIQEWRMKQSQVSGKGWDLQSSIVFQLDHLGLPSSSHPNSAPGSAVEQSQHVLHAAAFTEGGLAEGKEPAWYQANMDETRGNDQEIGKEEEEELLKDIAGFLDFDDDNEIEEQSINRHMPSTSQLRKDFNEGIVQDNQRKILRSTPLQVISRSHRRDLPFRSDMEKFTNALLVIFKSLIAREDEEIKREQLLSSLEEIVLRNWPEARLFLFGSCANAFGVCNSDIDVCLSIPGEKASKSELVMRLADVLRADEMQNVQALTHARVPIVKFTHPETGISCDICVNNMLAVVNTKLLHDYSQIDCRLRQLAFIVKHWAKQRQVNETYRGTLSSYAYVLMCIHFLQLRRPAILPCLQDMDPTYNVTVGKIHCAYYDQVEKLQNFGAKNKETLGELLISFFDYWAFRHDYSHAVISVRTGSVLSKIEKDWTRRIGNERHLVCIEDPFEISHDLGRVVDKHSIRILRDEFQRAAKILRYDPKPCVTLFEPYVREEK